MEQKRQERSRNRGKNEINRIDSESKKDVKSGNGIEWCGAYWKRSGIDTKRLGTDASLGEPNWKSGEGKRVDME